MRRLLLLGCLVPARVLAQPTPPPSPEPAPAPAPAPGPAAPTAEPAEVKPVEPTPAPAPAPPAPAPAATAANPYPTQPERVEPERSLNDGITIEVNLGFGWIRTSPEGEGGYTSDIGFGGLSGGVGGWLGPRLAITGRIASATVIEMGASQSAFFLGPSAQYWIDDRTWLGGGLGLGLLAASDVAGVDRGTSVGLGFDMRIGYTFSSRRASVWNASLELTPSVYSEDGHWAVLTGIGILAGYQHL